MSHIWQRYILREFFKIFFLFLGSFYFLYVLIDYSSHSKVYHQIEISKISFFYLCEFLKRADFLIPFAVLISSVKVFTTLNLRNELVAMAGGGIPLAKLLRPFFYAACACMAFLYLNFQFLQPFAAQHQTSLNQTDFKKNSLEEEKKVHVFVLEDRSLLLYRQFDAQKQAFLDVYWMKSLDQLYRMEKLAPFSEIPVGFDVTHLTRDLHGELIRANSYPTLSFPEMQFESKALFSVAHPPKWQSLTKLTTNLPWNKVFSAHLHDKEAEVISFLLYKLLFPLTCLLAVIAPAPFCLRFTRNLPVFFIYAFSLTGMIAYFTLFNSALALSTNQIFRPFFTMTSIPILFFLIFGLTYKKRIFQN